MTMHDDNQHPSLERLLGPRGQEIGCEECFEALDTYVELELARAVCAAVPSLEQVRFVSSGTEAVMQAVRLARYHTRRKNLVRFCGAYHGWWGDVQPGIGNPLPAHETYTLRDLSEEITLARQKSHEIDLVAIDPDLADTAAFCEKYGVPLDHSGNTIIVASKKEPKQFCACLVLATSRLDVNHTVRRLMDVSRVSFATADETKDLLHVRRLLADRVGERVGEECRGINNRFAGRYS